MGKISLGKGAKQGPLDPLSLPPMQTLKPLSEVITIQDSPVQALQTTVKKYVSPLSLSWKRQVPVTVTNDPSNSPETAYSKVSPAKVVSDCQLPTEAASSASQAQVTPTELNKPNRSHKSSDSDELDSAESGSKWSRLSEEAFNFSRICDASTPLASKLTSSNGSDGAKLNSGENALGKDLCISPAVNSEASTILKKKRNRRKRRVHKKLTKELPAIDVLDHLPEDSASSCIITAVNVQEMETVSPGLNKETCSPEKNRNVKRCEIIDLDMTNDNAKDDKAIELIAIKKLPKEPVEIIDLSNTLDGFGTAPSANDTIIVLDDDPPAASHHSKLSAKITGKTRDFENKNKSRKATTTSRLFKLQQHPGLIKKKERQKKKNKTANMLTQKCSNLQDEICFLGTGISLRPPKSTNCNPGSGHAAIQPHTAVPSAAAGSSTQNAQHGMIPPSSIFGSNFDNPNSNVQQTGLRPIVIDGSNVAMAHGKKEKMFSAKGIEICVNYFLKRGHKVYCFIPLFRKSDPCTKDRHILEKLEEQGHLICTPSRYVGSNTIVPYDDRYIVQIAAELGGVIISRDNFRDLIAENPAFKETIQQRTLMYTWVGDIIMFPTDPFGRCNVNLDRMLRF